MANCLNERIRFYRASNESANRGTINAIAHTYLFARPALFAVLLCSFMLVVLSDIPNAGAQLILNEMNAVGADDFVQIGGIGKPYEGYDYGVIPHSENNNSPFLDPVNNPNPGNPFAQDVDAGTAGSQQMLPNGWDGTTGWARIQGNGGDWVELVVTEDHTDLRDYTLFWENDENVPLGGTPNPGTIPEERGFIKFTNDKAWSNFRAGTIITISEQNFANEVRDEYPEGDDFTITGLSTDTGHDYDLNTDLSFMPFGETPDWHVHFHADETLTDVGTATQYFAGFSDVKSDKDSWRMSIFDSTNTAIVAEAESPGDISDLTTGLVQEPIGESGDGYGSLNGATGVGNDETLTLRADPANGITSNAYEDVDFSSFGAPNVFNDLSEAGLDGVQDFAPLRDPVMQNTFQWAATGTASFGDASSWQLANDGSAAPSGSAASWSVELSNDSASPQVAEVSADATVRFATVAGGGESMTLEVTGGSRLQVVDGDQPGRILVEHGGVIGGEGEFEASEVELFGGTTSPGDELGTLTIDGDYIQHEDATLKIEIGGFGAGMFDVLDVLGEATLDGDLEIDLVNGFNPTSSATIDILNASSIAGTLTLTGDIADFALVETATTLSLQFTGTGGVPGDYDGNGSVGPEDLALWQQDFGSTTALDADGNGNGRIDGGDFLFWQRTVTNGASSGLQAVPEPSSIAIISMAALATGLLARRAS